MIIPIAFRIEHSNDAGDFDVNQSLADIVAAPRPWDTKVYVAVVDVDTLQGLTIELQAVPSIKIADPYHSTGTMRRFFGGEVVDPAAALQKIADLYGNRAYLRALRDKLNGMNLEIA